MATFHVLSINMPFNLIEPSILLLKKDFIQKFNLIKALIWRKSKDYTILCIIKTMGVKAQSHRDITNKVGLKTSDGNYYQII